MGIMKVILVLISLSFLFSFSLAGESKASKTSDSVYIVYMGAAAPSNRSLRNEHDQLLNSLLRRKPKALVQTYKHGFTGFAARLSEDEAHSIAQKPGVVSVFRDPVLQLHTTHSWDFLKYQTAVKIDSNPNSNTSSSSSGSDTIIGILDTGIWPESESFNDKDMGPIPSHWKGTCMESQDFNSSNCNKKLIGARFYKDQSEDSDEYQTARDTVGHGTHVASTAAGTTVEGASYFGLAAGTATGGSPASRIAMYRVCSSGGCEGSKILAAFDDAIADGVDVLSLSLGARAFAQPPLEEDPIAIGSFHAVEKGITVVCSAGNDGPTAQTVSNVAPWILTVAASTIDRDLESNVVLGGNKVVKGGGIHYSALNQSPDYTLIHGKSAMKNGASEEGARNCNEDSMDKEAVKGKIVVCETTDGYATYGKSEAVMSLGGVGVIIVSDAARFVVDTYGSFAGTAVSSKDAKELFSYINSTRNPVATILQTVTVTKFMPAPVMAYFSGRGPSSSAKNILKPDITAPGVNILAAWIANDTSQETPAGKQPSLFNVISGTSMSCPHVSGIAANVKSQYPNWTPSAIRSAIMTTATQTNNMRAPIAKDTGDLATPYDYGAGEVTTQGPLDPGLVYETSTIDYLNYLCYRGYNVSTLKVISRTIPNDFTCPEDTSAEAMSNINYPSIAISKYDEKASTNITRTVTNVAGDGETVFTATIDAPSGLNVKVIPDKLQFTKNNQKLSYQVVFSSAASSLNSDVFGSITWANEKYKARIPFVLTKSK